MNIKAGTPLVWVTVDRCENAILGDFDGGDGVRFSIVDYPSCYRRGRYRLLVEVAEGPGHIKWGCFDDQDQPMRYYHYRDCAIAEAQAIADVLAFDRSHRA